MSGFVAMLMMALPGGSMEREFFVSFAGAADLHPGLGRYGRDAAAAMRFDDEGLRIELAGQREATGPVGISPQFRIGGDFEITAGYQILAADKPPKGLGAGLKLWGGLAADEFQAITLAHLVRPSGQSGVLGIYARQPKGQKRQPQMKMRPSKATAGRLRIVRRGSELTLLAAEHGSDTFHEIQRATVGTGDVTALRLMATTHDAPVRATVRLVDLEIRADRLPGKPTVRPLGRWRLSVVWGLIVVVVAAVGGAVVCRRWWLGRRRS